MTADLTTYDLGALPKPGGVQFTVWAPKKQQVEVEIVGGRSVPMSEVAEGLWLADLPEARIDDLYRYRIGGWGYPDPYSRFQPSGPHGPSMIVDPYKYRWRDGAWTGLSRSNQILYELHIGTFTEAGTYQAAAAHLPRLQELGVTCLELMPVNEFVGDFGWGYDGVNWFAPYHRYGTPDDLRAFIDDAHACGLGVILDVVYNHFGHDGNYLPVFAADYLTDKIKNPWGAAPNYACQAMRRLAIDNARYWIGEFHFDGLRLDAIQSVFDPAPPVAFSRVGTGGASRCRAAHDHCYRGRLLAADTPPARCKRRRGRDRPLME